MQEEEITKGIDLGLAKIMCLANIINRKTTMGCVTSDLGYIRSLRLEVYPHFSNPNKQAPAKFEISYDTDSSRFKLSVDSKHRLEAIERCIEFLEATLKEKKIAFNMTDEVKKWVTVGYEI